MKTEWKYIVKDGATFIAVIEAAIAAHGPVLWRPFTDDGQASEQDAQWEIYCDSKDAEREAREEHEA